MHSHTRFYYHYNIYTLHQTLTSEMLIPIVTVIDYMQWHSHLLLASLHASLQIMYLSDLHLAHLVNTAEKYSSLTSPKFTVTNIPHV